MLCFWFGREDMGFKLIAEQVSEQCELNFYYYFF